MNKSKEKVKENPIVTDRAIRMANPCHRIDKVVPPYWHNPYTKSSRRKTKVFFLLSFSDLSHHRTCGSAYGGSLFYVQSDIVIHKTGIAREPEFIIGRCMVHYTLRICPIPLAAIPIYACPIGLDSAFDEIGNPCLWVFPTFPYTHSYPSAKPLINSYQR